MRSEVNAIPPTAQGLPIEQLEALVLAGADSRSWQLERLGPGHFAARHDRFGDVADITVDNRLLRVSYREASELLSDNNAVRQYNFAVHNLTTSIMARLIPAR